MELESVKQALAQHPFLEGFRPEHIDKLVAMAFEVRFERDQLIFREGDESSFFYLLLAGKVALDVQAPRKMFRIQTVGAGDELGWSSMLSPVRKRFQARCVQAGTALAFDGARLLSACEDDPAFGYQLMRRVVRTVAQRLQATRLQLIDMYSASGAKVS